jgi:hypothetical protein
VFYTNKILAQSPDQIYESAIHTVLLAPMGSPLAAPITDINGSNVLQLSFDDLNANYESYYYSIELMDSNWKPAALNDFEYVKGFNQNKITSYSVSSIATQKYFHYQLSFPNNYCAPKLSGNYILKVFKNNNKDQVVFTKRFYVVENIASVLAMVQAPFDGSISRSHQKIKVSVDTRNIPSFQNDRITIKVIQNNRYSDAKTVTTPNFIRGYVLEFNDELELIFPGGNEARWLDLQSLQLRSDRVASLINKDQQTTVLVKPDISRNNLLYASYRDLNGGYLIMNTESLQNENQNDYALVVFTYLTKDHSAYLDKKLYLAGALTNNVLDKNAEMQFNASIGAYQKKILLKQGYYSYNYILRDRLQPSDLDDFLETEGSFTETENEYTILVYYHAPGTRNDQIIGFASVNTSQN